MKAEKAQIEALVFCDYLEGSEIPDVCRRFGITDVKARRILKHRMEVVRRQYAKYFPEKEKTDPFPEDMKPKELRLQKDRIYKMLEDIEALKEAKVAPEALAKAVDMGTRTYDPFVRVLYPVNGDPPIQREERYRSALRW